MKNRLLICLFVFLVLRIAFSYFTGWKEIPPGSDAISFNSYALTILDRADWLTDPDFKGNYREPGYPVFLAIIYLIFGKINLFAVYFFQAILGILTVYYIYKLSALLFDEQIAFLALIWSGFYIFYLWYCSMIFRETLIFFLMIFSFYNLWGFLIEKKKENVLTDLHLWQFIIAFTVLLHTDARYLFYIPFISILFVTYKKFWIGIKEYLLVMGILILLLVPWSIRNFVAYNGFVLINTRTLDLRAPEVRNDIMYYLIDNNLLNYGVISESGTKGDKNYPTEEERKLIKQGFNPNNRSTDEIHAIDNDMYPASIFFKRKIYWLVELWRPARFKSDYFPFPDTRFQKRWSLSHNLLGILSYGLLLPAMFLGFFNLIKAKNNVWVFLILPILVQTLLHVLQWGRNRYRIPIDCFIIIVSMHGIYYVYEKIKSIIAIRRKI